MRTYHQSPICDAIQFEESQKPDDIVDTLSDAIQFASIANNFNFSKLRVTEGSKFINLDERFKTYVCSITVPVGRRWVIFGADVSITALININSESTENSLEIIKQDIKCSNSWVSDKPGLMGLIIKKRISKIISLIPENLHTLTLNRKG